MVNAGAIGAIAVIAVILSAFGSYYVTATPLNAQVSSYQTSISSYESNVSSYQSIVSSMSAHPSTTTLTTTSISTSTTTSIHNITYTTLETVTSTTTYTYRIDQVPSSALVVTAESYSNATKLITMTVQNTENYTVYAQVSATMYGNPCCGFGNVAGSYSSTVFQFNPLASSIISFSITQGNYYGDCIGYVSTVQLYFTVATQSGSSQASGNYTFQISPAFPNPYQNCP
ncbi:MAG: hypothetical protein JRN15_16890 [Nitrososphaerota archaeon]|nr:hypothetical protein [Nitrososphaerota archaeon]